MYLVQVDKIIFNWWSEKYRLGMTASGEVYRWQDNELHQLSKEAHRSSLVYRMHGSSIRISRNQFLKTCRPCRMIIERDLPF